MTDKPQFTCTLLPDNEVRFWSLSRRAKVKPEYRPMGAERYHSQEAVIYAVDHYRKTGKIRLHDEVKALFRGKKREKKQENRPMRRRETIQQEELRV